MGNGRIFVWEIIVIEADFGHYAAGDGLHKAGKQIDLDRTVDLVVAERADEHTAVEPAFVRRHQRHLRHRLA